MAEIDAEKCELEVRLKEMISVQEHESVLNSELSKAMLAANEKFAQVKRQFEEHLAKSLKEKEFTCEREAQQALVQRKQVTDQQRSHELEQVKLRHAKELRD